MLPFYADMLKDGITCSTGCLSSNIQAGHEKCFRLFSAALVWQRIGKDYCSLHAVSHSRPCTALQELESQCSRLATPDTLTELALLAACRGLLPRSFGRSKAVTADLGLASAAAESPAPWPEALPAEKGKVWIS